MSGGYFPHRSANRWFASMARFKKKKKCQFKKYIFFLKDMFSSRVRLYFSFTEHDDDICILFWSRDRFRFRVFNLAKFRYDSNDNYLWKWAIVLVKNGTRFSVIVNRLLEIYEICLKECSQITCHKTDV